MDDRVLNALRGGCEGEMSVGRVKWMRVRI